MPTAVEKAREEILLLLTTEEHLLDVTDAIELLERYMTESIDEAILADRQKNAEFYRRQVKDEALQKAGVELIYEARARIAKELGISPETLLQWMKNPDKFTVGAVKQLQNLQLFGVRRRGPGRPSKKMQEEVAEIDQILQEEQDGTDQNQET